MPDRLEIICCRYALAEDRSSDCFAPSVRFLFETVPILEPVKHVDASAGITHFDREIPARQVVRLQAQLLGRRVGAGPAVAEVVEVSVATGLTTPPARKVLEQG